MGKYKVLVDDVFEEGKGEVIEREAHAMEEHLRKGEVQDVTTVSTRNTKSSVGGSKKLGQPARKPRSRKS